MKNGRDSGGPLEELIGEIERTLSCELWLMALFSTLALPDICAALQSLNGRSTAKKYKNWVNKWLSGKYPSLDGEELYEIRCSFLHQGRTKVDEYDRIMFTIPVHPIRLNNFGFVSSVGAPIQAITFDIVYFCNDVISAVRDWQCEVLEDEVVIANSDHLVRYYPDGLSPYMGGIPVIS